MLPPTEGSPCVQGGISIAAPSASTLAASLLRPSVGRSVG